MIRHAGITVDVHRRTISYGGREVRLPHTSVAEVARDLLANAATVVETGTFADRLWGDREDGGPLYTKTRINGDVWHLRRALADIGAPCTVETWHRVGYILRVANPEAQRNAA